MHLVKYPCHKILVLLSFIFFVTIHAQHLEIQGTVQGPSEAEWEHGFVFLSGEFPLFPPWDQTKPVLLDQKNFQFSPKVVALIPGQDLKVKNSDEELHNIHAYGEEGATRFNIPILAKMKTSIRIEKVEVLDLFCDIHAQMRAYILCLENPYFTRLNADGSFDLKSLPDQATEISFWHPYLEPQTLNLSGQSPLIFKTQWRAGFQPKSKTTTAVYKVYSFQEIAQEITKRLEEVPALPKEQAFAILDDCYFTLYEAGGMETAVRFHLSGGRAFLHEQGFRDIKTALRDPSASQSIQIIQKLTQDLRAGAEELQSLGIENKPAFSTGAIEFSQKPKRNEYLAQMTTRKLGTLFQETEDLSLAEMILETCRERHTPYIERFLSKFSEGPLKKQILFLKHLRHFPENAQTRCLLLECTNQDSWMLRSTALEVLRLYPGVENIFQKYREDPSPIVQQKAIQGSVYQAGSNCLTVAEPTLQIENPDLRLATVYGLIEVAQRTTEGGLKESIQKRLLRLGADVENRPDIRQELWKFLGPASQEQWIRALSEENPHIREAVLTVAAQHNYELALFLGDGLCDPENRVRLTALLLLSKISENAPLVERIHRWIVLCQTDADVNIQALAKTFEFPQKRSEALADLQLFLNAYASGHLRTAYFFLSTQEQNQVSFSQFARSYWMSSQLQQWFSTATIGDIERESEKVSVQVKLGSPKEGPLVFFILKKDGLFWKITKKQ